jgi:hypothetical protein
MSDASTMYETREAIAAQRRLSGGTQPVLAAFSPIALYVGIALAIVVGTAINMTGGAPAPATSSAVAQVAAAR